MTLKLACVMLGYWLGDPPVPSSAMIGLVPSAPFMAAYSSRWNCSESYSPPFGSFTWLQRMIDGWLRSRSVSARAWATMLARPALKSCGPPEPRMAVSSMIIRPSSSAVSSMYGLAGSWWIRTVLKLSRR